MKSISGKQFAKSLEKKAWVMRSVKGSHHVYMKSGNPARISIPIHGDKPLKIGLLKHLMKLADLSKDEM